MIIEMKSAASLPAGRQAGLADKCKIVD